MFMEISCAPQTLASPFLLRAHSPPAWRRAARYFRRIKVSPNARGQSDERVATHGRRVAVALLFARRVTRKKRPRSLKKATVKRRLLTNNRKPMTWRLGRVFPRCEVQCRHGPLSKRTIYSLLCVASRVRPLHNFTVSLCEKEK